MSCPQEGEFFQHLPLAKLLTIPNTCPDTSVPKDRSTTLLQFILVSLPIDIV